MMHGLSAYGPAALVALCAFVMARSPAPEEKEQKKKEAASAPAREELPGSLDDMIAAAIRSNPDVLRAEAKLIQAQMALNQARLRTTEEVIATAHERDRIERMLGVAEAAFDGARRRVEMGVAGREELVQAEAGIIDARAKIEQNRAHLRYLLGIGGEKGLREPGRGAQEPAKNSARKRPDFSPRQKEMLEKKVRIEGPTIKVKDLLERTTGEMVIAPSPLDQLEVLAPKAKETEIPLRVLLELLADSTNRGLVFVFRDYGILVTSEDVARKTRAPAIPEETPLDLD